MNWYTRIVFALGMRNIRRNLATILVLSATLFSGESATGQSANAVPIASASPILTSTERLPSMLRFVSASFPRSGTPCSTTGVLLYSDDNLSQQINDPTATNSHGLFSFFINSSQYTLPQLFQVQVTTMPGSTYVYYFLAGVGGGGGGIPYPGGTGVPEVTGGASWGSTYNAGNQIPLNFVTPGATSNLTDWNNSGVTSGYVPIWSSIASKWTAAQMLTSNLGDWTDSGVANGNCPVWNSGTSKWTPGSCGGGGTQIVAGNNVAIPQGSPCTGPICTINSLANGSQCDIRSQGATLNAQDIGPYIQDCINAYYPTAAGNTQTILLPCGNGSTNGNSCWWAHPSALAFPHGGPVKILLSGYLSVGSPLVVDSNQNWYGTGPPGAPVQFQPGVIAGIFAPQLYGTLGSDCATPNAPCVVTPTFGCSGTSQNSIFGNCNIGYMPPGAAITVAGTTTCSFSRATVFSRCKRGSSEHGSGLSRGDAHSSGPAAFRGS